MNVDAILCDAATVREGLLNVLGAGITRLWRDQFPAVMGTQLALLIHSSAREMNSQHKLMITITHESQQRVAEFGVDFAIGPTPGALPDEVITVPMVATLQQQVLPSEGAYTIEISVDGETVRSTTFYATPSPKQAQVGSAKG
jgi:hypothetical protein